MNINDGVLSRANDLFASMKPGELVNKAMEEMVARESARRLADLLRSDPDATAPARREARVMEDGATYNPPKK